jgi:hypothetical protein
MWFLNTYTTKDELVAAVDSITYVGGNTNTSGGLRAMHYEQFIQSRGDRIDIPNIAFVITDGVSTFDSHRTISEAQAARKDMITIVSVGITQDVNTDELKAISSEPQEESVNYFTSVDFNSLSIMVSKLVEATCSGAPADCTTSLVDLVFVIDSSGSIRDNNPLDGSFDNYKLLLDFVNSIVDRLNIGVNGSRVGVVRFSDYGDSVFYLNSYTNKNDMTIAIQQIGYMGGNTNTSGGIREMKDVQFTEANGDRPDVKNIAIIITDGKSTFDSDRTIPDANTAKSRGIQIYSVGITNAANEEELRLMSSDPQVRDQNYWLSADFTTLATIGNQIVSETCKTNNEDLYCRFSAITGKQQCFCRHSECLIKPVNGSMCYDVDECSTNNGGCQHICTNHAGYFECSCKNGYILNTDRRTCGDKNECETREATCGSGEDCVNTIGSYYCARLFANAVPQLGELDEFAGEPQITDATLGVTAALSALVATIIVVATVLIFREVSRRRRRAFITDKNVTLAMDRNYSLYGEPESSPDTQSVTSSMLY